MPATSWPVIPVIAAFIYQPEVRGDKQAPRSQAGPWARIFAPMMAKANSTRRGPMYFILHSDTNPATFPATPPTLCIRQLSDPYYAYSAGLNGLAGPLHGLANQEVLSWTMKFQEKVLQRRRATKELDHQSPLGYPQLGPGHFRAMVTPFCARPIRAICRSANSASGLRASRTIRVSSWFP